LGYHYPLAAGKPERREASVTIHSPTKEET
jgi:hypothetical protein